MQPIARKRLVHWYTCRFMAAINASGVAARDGRHRRRLQSWNPVFTLLTTQF